MASIYGPRVDKNSNPINGWERNPVTGHLVMSKSEPTVELNSEFYVNGYTAEYLVIETRVADVCREAGLGGVMPGVFGVIQDRYEKSAKRGLPNLTADEVYELHEDFIERAVTDTEQWALRYSKLSEGTLDEATSHIEKISEAACCPGVMPGILQSVIDRDPENTTLIARLNGLTEYDLDDIYNGIVGPAIDKVDKRLALSHCDECGESTVDDTMFWALCPGCGSEDNELVGSR
jgi:hypothetical protein